MSAALHFEKWKKWCVEIWASSGLDCLARSRNRIFSNWTVVQTAVQNLHILLLLLSQPSNVFLCSLLALLVKAGNAEAGNRGYGVTFSSCLLVRGVWECSNGAAVGVTKTEPGEVLTQHVQDSGNRLLPVVKCLFHTQGKSSCLSLLPLRGGEFLILSGCCHS